MVAYLKFNGISPTHAVGWVDGWASVRSSPWLTERSGGFSMQVLRLGEFLVLRGVLTREQADRIVEHQERTARPFGVLAEELFGVDPAAIESAWASQYEAMSPALELAEGEPSLKAIAAVTKRRARQFGVAPVRIENGILVLATTRENLPRALRFGLRVLERPCSFVVGSPKKIDAILAQCYVDHATDAA